MWFKIDDKLHDHPKVQRLLEQHGEAALPAMGLWTLAGAWCGDQMSDGVISGFVLRRWADDWAALALVLVDVGLWEAVEVDGRDHHRFHDWLDFNDSKEQIESDRRAKAMRVALQRDVQLITAIKRRDKDRCRYCGTQVDWRARRGAASATYDHVVPIEAGGKNTLGNVVIACKGCNDLKNRQSLREAGMKLLAPGSPGAPILDEDAPAPSRTKNVPSTDAGVPRSTTGSGRVGSGAHNVPRTPAGPDRARTDA